MKDVFCTRTFTKLQVNRIWTSDNKKAVDTFKTLAIQKYFIAGVEPRNKYMNDNLDSVLAMVFEETNMFSSDLSIRA